MEEEAADWFLLCMGVLSAGLEWMGGHVGAASRNVSCLALERTSWSVSCFLGRTAAGAKSDGSWFVEGRLSASFWDWTGPLVLEVVLGR